MGAPLRMCEGKGLLPSRPGLPLVAAARGPPIRTVSAGAIRTLRREARAAGVMLLRRGARGPQEAGGGGADQEHAAHEKFGMAACEAANIVEQVARPAVAEVSGRVVEGAGHRIDEARDPLVVLLAKATRRFVDRAAHDAGLIGEPVLLLIRHAFTFGADAGGQPLALTHGLAWRVASSLADAAHRRADLLAGAVAHLVEVMSDILAVLPES